MPFDLLDDLLDDADADADAGEAFGVEEAFDVEEVLEVVELAGVFLLAKNDSDIDDEDDEDDEDGEEDVFDGFDFDLDCKSCLRNSLLGSLPRNFGFDFDSESDDNGEDGDGDDGDGDFDFDSDSDDGSDSRGLFLDTNFDGVYTKINTNISTTINRNSMKFQIILTDLAGDGDFSGFDETFLRFSPN